MHDWTLTSLGLEWKSGVATLKFLNTESNTALLVAKGVVVFNVPRGQEWGRSVSVNELLGPIVLENGCQKLQIEMQSGDVIEIVAESFELPFAEIL